jgi:hypothetical protein
MMTSGYPRAKSGDTLSLMVAKAVLFLVSLLASIALLWTVRQTPRWAWILIVVGGAVLFAFIGWLVAVAYETAYRRAQQPRDRFHRANLVYIAAFWPVTLACLVVGVPLIATINRLFPAEAH